MAFSRPAGLLSFWSNRCSSATPHTYGPPTLIDETLEPFDTSAIVTGDIVGIGIHTGNALRGYEIGNAVKARGATVVFGGIHATLYPDEAHDLGGERPMSRLLQGDVGSGKTVIAAFAILAAFAGGRRVRSGGARS